MKHKFELKDMLPIALTLIVLGIGVAYGLNVMEDVQDDTGTTSCAARSDTLTNYNATSGECYNTTTQVNVGTHSFNASGDAIEGTAKIPEKLPLIVTVIVAAIILGILLRYLVINFK